MTEYNGNKNLKVYLLKSARCFFKKKILSYPILTHTYTCFVKLLGTDKCNQRENVFCIMYLIFIFEWNVYFHLVSVHNKQYMDIRQKKIQILLFIQYFQYVNV